MKPQSLVITAMLALAVPVAFSAEDSGAIYAKSTLTKIGETAPVLSLTTIDNQILDFHGKVVVLNFFATWCGPCMQEMPHLEKDLWKPLKSKGLLAISVGREHSQSEVNAFQKQKGYTFLFAADPKREIYGKFATQYIPRCILIGKDGRIKYQSVGFTEKEFGILIDAVKSELDK